MDTDQLPSFPHFEPIKTTSKKAVNFYTSNHLPYATFSYLNVQVWDVYGDRKVSNLNGNLVLLNSDYETREPFLTILGVSDFTDSIKKLHVFAHQNNISRVLRSIPEESARLLSMHGLHITEERDGFEYIYSTEHLSLNSGSRFKKKRKQVRIFEETYPHVKFVLEDLTSPKIHDQLVSTLKQWEMRKLENNKPCNSDLEARALNRFLKNFDYQDVILSCLFDKEMMIGFSIDELLPNKFVMAHFVKADNNYKGIYEFLNERTAINLREYGGEYWNWQQDLGIEGLRQLKQSYHPVQYLKKYSVDLDAHLDTLKLL